MRPVWAEINLQAVGHNLREIRRIIPSHTKIMAIVKANAYGHGAGAVVPKLLEAGADYLGVAILAEALEMREQGIKAPILILGYTGEEYYPLVVKYELTQTIFSLRQAESLSKAAVSLNKKVKVHLKIDTGMGRIGFLVTPQAVKEVEEIAQLPGLELEGIFTHLANADAGDKSYCRFQLDNFFWFVRQVEQAGIKIKYKHVANSAAIIDLPQCHLDLVRPGIMLYGLYPSKEVAQSKVKLVPAMSLKARITHLKEVGPGTSISYGCTYTTKEKALIATLPLGYADGYTRLLSNKGMALVRGRKVPVVGRICMDQCMLNVSNVPGVALGDEVVLLGRQGTASISADELAELIGTINYEVLCMLSSRVPRIYV